jgi:putative ABC transport system substrate-binding protein
LAARYRLPTIYPLREFVASGGRISYGASSPARIATRGTYAAQILKGTKPADLPVLQATAFELIINRKTAKALGLTVPSTPLASIDELIEH